MKMNDTERAIEILQKLLDSNVYEELTKSAFNMAIKSLEEQLNDKQIPMKIKFKRSDDEIYCPNPSCRSYIKENEYFGYPIGEDENYCKVCGQKLDWSEAQE